MNKIKITLYSILITLFPIIFVVAFGFITRQLEIVRSRTFEATGYLVWVLVSNLFSGCMFAVIAFMKKEYYKSKLILISHISSVCILLILFSYILLYMSGTITVRFTLRPFSHILQFVKIENVLFAIGFMIFATIKAFSLKRAIND